MTVASFVHHPCSLISINLKPELTCALRLLLTVLPMTAGRGQRQSVALFKLNVPESLFSQKQHCLFCPSPPFSRVHQAWTTYALLGAAYYCRPSSILTYHCPALCPTLTITSSTLPNNKTFHSYISFFMTSSNELLWQNNKIVFQWDRYK